MKLKKIIVVLMCIAAFTGLLCGCDKKIYITTGLKDSEIFKLSGQPCRLSEMLLVLMTEKNRYEADLGNGIWLYEGSEEGRSIQEEIKTKVKSQLAQLKTIELMAEKEEILLSDTEKMALESAAKEYFTSLSEDTVKLLQVTEDDVLSLYTSFYMADKVYEKLTIDVNVEVSDEEARVIEFKYILFATCKLNEAGDKVPVDEQEKKSAYTKAQEALELLNSGSDFATIANKYSDSNDTGGYLSRGEVQESIEEAVYKLKTGEISSIIEAEDGYYILMCVSDYLEAETIENKARLMEQYKKKAYDDIYVPFEADQTFEFNNKVWDEIDLKDYSEVTTSTLYNVYNKWVAPTTEE